MNLKMLEIEGNEYVRCFSHTILKVCFVHYCLIDSFVANGCVFVAVVYPDTSTRPGGNFDQHWQDIKPLSSSYITCYSYYIPMRTCACIFNIDDQYLLVFL